MFRTFWPDVRGGYFFRHRRAFLDFMQKEGWKIFYLPDSPFSRPPFVLVGNWRARKDITALWHIKAEGNDRRSLVSAAVQDCFSEGTEKVITKLLNEREAEEFAQWNFHIACKIALLERYLRTDILLPTEKGDLRIMPFKKKALDDVLRVDASAFDDFWRLDADTLEAIASSCVHNVFLLARNGGETLGYAIGGANDRIAYLQRLGVHARHQGQGVGECLVAGILRALKRLGATTVMVNTQEDNLSALNLYRSMGFHETADSRYIMHCLAGDRDRGIK
jgi:ribosomal protein S18 acetylase RimI-like enzyme